MTASFGPQLLGETEKALVEIPSPFAGNPL